MYGANPSQQGMMNGGAPQQGQYQPGRGPPQAMQGMNPMTAQHSQIQGMPQHPMGMGSHPGQMYSTQGSYPVGMQPSHYPNSSPRFVNMQQPGINMQDKNNVAMQQHSQYSAMSNSDFDQMSRTGFSSQPTMSYSSNSMQHVRMQHGGMPRHANMQPMQGQYPTSAYGHNNHMNRMQQPAANMTPGKMDMRPQGMHSSYNPMQQQVQSKQPLPTVDTGSYMQRPPSADKKQPGFYSSMPNPSNQPYPTSYSNSMENIHRMSYSESSHVRMQQQPNQRATVPPSQMSNQMQRPGYPNQSHQSQYLGTNQTMPQTVSPGQNIPPASPHLQAPALSQSPVPGSTNMGQRSRVPHHQGSMPMRSPIAYDNQGPMSPRMNYPNQSPRSYQNNANFNHMPPQSPGMNASSTPVSYGNRFLSPKPNVSSTMPHQQPQTAQKPIYHMNQMQPRHAGPGNQQFQPNRMPDPTHNAYGGNQWQNARSMQSPPGIQQSSAQPSPLNSPNSNQITPQKAQPLPQQRMGMPSMNNTKAMPDPNMPGGGNDFNLDSLLSDPMDSGGSFMQQLQGIPQSKTPTENNSNQPPINPIPKQNVTQNQQNSIDNNQIGNLPKPTMNVESNAMTNNLAPNVNQQKITADQRPNDPGITAPLPPQLPTLENINYKKDVDALNDIKNQEDTRQQQPTDTPNLATSTSITSPLTAVPFESNSINAQQMSDNDARPPPQPLFPTSTSGQQMPTNSVQLTPSSTSSTNVTSEPVKPDVRFGSPPHSAEKLTQFNAGKIPSNSAGQIASFPNAQLSTTMPSNTPSDQAAPASQLNTAPTVPHSTTMPHASPMSSPTKSRFPTPLDSNSIPTGPPSSVQPPHSTPQVSMPNRMPLPHAMQGPNFQPTSMDPRLPNQMQRMPTDGSIPHGYRQMGPQPGMPNAPYQQHGGHVPPGQPGPRMYPYPPRPFNPNMPQMNYMPRPGPGGMPHEMGGPLRPYGPPQGIPPHIHQQHQHLQMLERDIQSFRMQLRTEQHPPRVEEIKRRLGELESRRHHLIQQLHHAQAQSGQMQGIELTPPPTGVMPPGAEEMSSAKKKRLRKKDGKDEDLVGKDKPPKKKKKKELLPGATAKGKKKGKKSREDPDEAAYMPIMSEPGSEGSLPYAPNLAEPAVNPPTIEPVVSEDPTYTLPQSTKRKKKPPATIVKPKKKKRKRGEESDEEHMLKVTPPPSPDDSLLEKRRSSRNVKRKRYIETFDLHLSDDGAEHQADEGEMLKQQQAAVKQDTGTDEDQLIVDKILSHRIRKVPIYKSPVKPPAQAPSEPTDNKTEESNEANEKEPAENENSTVINDISPPEEDNTAEGPSLQNDQDTVQPPPHKPTVEQPKLPEPEIVGYKEVEEFLIKHKNYSYLHCDWKTLEEIGDKRADAKIKRYKSKIANMNDFASMQFDNDEPFNPDFTVVDRVLDVSVQQDEDGKPIKHYLVKWCALPYEDSTWESQESIEPIKIKEFEIRCSYRPPDMKVMVPPKHSWRKLTLQDSYFKNNNMLRDYQLEGISWMLFNWYNRRNCILADEMGLGKTIQSITFLQKIFDHGIKGPFLIVAPLSTIANWQREFEGWTDINAVVYHGSQTSRDMIHTYEFMCRDENLDEIPDKYKLHAVITTYEMIVLESSHLSEVDWRCLIIDEAHRLKNRTCKLADSLNSMELEFKVLLTGTPLQNNIEELFALLNFLQPDTFNSEQAFSNEFGTLKDNAQVEKLQELLKPMMLRRLKEDVEKSIAPKEETIIEVELTNIQKKYYRAILERNFEFLSKGTTSGNVPNLMNTMMELRKCCNHPYLIKGAEDKIQLEYSMEHPDDFNALQVMIQSAGKLVLIDKLLPKLKANGHKVLIFSQMVKCLDILEDYLMQKHHLYERIDGCVRGNDRQMAIDRFSKPGSDRFVFLLCTRAGGLGINLTAADTVIIFDSDWNPQNDLQAQARCHRIGQQKSVKVYRLITRNSYEREMFDKASMKLGLDKAVLQSISGRQDQSMQTQQALTKHEVEDLLKRGAYGAIMDDNDDANKFCEEDIDQILQRRTHTITIESEKGSTFSKASFVSAEDRTDISLDDPNFWEKWAKKADLDLDRMTNNKLIIEQPRRRKQTRRFGGMTADDEVLAEIGSDSDSDYEDRPSTRKQKNKLKSVWSRRDCFRVIKSLLTFGWGRWKTILNKCGFPSYVTEQDLEEISRIVLIYCLKFYNGDEKIKVFIWDLITPAGHASVVGVDFKNHEGLAAPVPRGRKGRKAKEESERKQQQIIERDWAKDIKVDSVLQDDGFKKHLQHQCNKVLLRIRTLYYLRTEILGPYGPAIEEGASAKSLDIEIPEKVGDPLTSWWDADCDKSLLIGIYKHGYEKYNLMRADSTLCFLDKVGRPDDKALAAEMEVEEDAGADPEYKPAKVVFNDYSEFDDSPAPNTPNTEPASPTDDKDFTKSDSVKDKLAPVLAGEWPLISELNMRMRRLITCFQKHYKLIQAKMMNLERRNMRRDRMSESPRYRKEFQARWTRREETDFYRTISTFGVEYNDKGDLVWTKFRNLAKLDRKSDDSLRSYYLAFKAMCERIAGRKNITPLPKDAANLQIEPISEERASRTLYRLQTLDKIRLDVLKHEDLEERLQLCQPSLDLPVWWVPAKHDKELLLGMDRHGITRTEVHILSDPNFSFLNAMKEFESKPLKEQKLLISMQKFGDEISERINSAGNIEIADLDSKFAAKKGNKNPKDNVKTENVKNEDTNLNINNNEKSETMDDVKDDKSSPKSETSVIKSTKEANEEASEDKKLEDQEEISTPKREKEPPNKEGKELNQSSELVEDKSEKIEVDSEKNDEASAKVHETSDEKADEKSSTKVDDETTVKKDEEEKVKAPSPNNDAKSEVKSEEVEEEVKESSKEESKEADEVDSLKQEIKKEANEDENKITTKNELTTEACDDESKEKNDADVKSKEIAHSASMNNLDDMVNFIQSQTITTKWPKDRILVQRVELICHCVLNGEWPSVKESRELCVTPSLYAGSGTSSPIGTPRAIDSPRQSPVPTSKMHHSVSMGGLTAAELSNLNPMMMSENELIAAMLQMQQHQQQGSNKSYNTPGRSRGRRKKKGGRPMSPRNQNNRLMQQVAEQQAKEQQELQRQLEEMYLLNSFTQAVQSSSAKHKGADKSADFFPDLNSIKQNMLKGGGKDESSLGNSSASLLAKLQELATAKPDKESSQDQWLRNTHKQSKDSKSRDYGSSSKQSSRHQALDNPFQLPPEMLAGMPFNQLLQESLKSGNPNLFPLLMDPNFLLNESAKLMQQQAGSSNKMNMPALSQAELDKLFQNMPELALSLFPPGLLTQFSPSQKPSSSKKQDKQEKTRSKDTLSSKIQSLEMANEQALQSISKEFLEKQSNNDDSSTKSKSDPDNAKSSSLASELASKLPSKSPARKPSKLDAMFGGGSKGSEASPKSGRTLKKSKKSKLGFISPAVLPLDTRIPVHNSSEGKKLSGEDAPLNKDLADWLNQNPGFVVDYQVLRQQLDESSETANAQSKALSAESKVEKSEQQRTESPTPSVESETSFRQSNKSPVSTKHGPKHTSSSRASTPSHNRTQTPAKNNVSPSPSLKQQEALFGNNPFANLPPNFMNNFQGLPPDFAALVASGLMPGLPGMPFPKLPGQEMNFNQLPGSGGHSSSRSSQKESRRKEKGEKEHRSKDRDDGRSSDKQKDSGGRTSQQSSSNFPSQDAMAADSAFAAALGAGMMPGGLMADPLQFMAAMQASGMQVDPKAMAGFPMLPFLGGMPGANPIFPGFLTPEAAAAMESLPGSSKRDSSEQTSSDSKKFSSSGSIKDSDKKTSTSGKSSSSSSKSQFPTHGGLTNDPFTEALMALQMSGGNFGNLPGNPFLHPSQANLMMPPMLGMNNMGMPSDMFTPDALLQAQLQALGGVGGLPFPMDLKPPTSSSKKTGSVTPQSFSSSNSNKSEGRHSTKSKDETKSNSGSKCEEEPMDLTQH